MSRGESPEECVTREVKEETGFTLTSYKFRGMVTFISDEWDAEYMHIFTADGFTAGDSGEIYGAGGLYEWEEGYDELSAVYTDPLPECGEGELAWVDRDKIKDLSLWEGDRIFLQLLQVCDEFFSLKFVYQGESLKEVYINGEKANKNMIPYLGCI